MGSSTIRSLDDSLKSRLHIQAAVRDRSMESEARDILRSALNQEPPGPENLDSAINGLFKPFGGFDVPKVSRMLTPHPKQEATRRKPNREAVRETARSYNVHNSKISRLAA